jgi:uroporphyrin-III C-methyltransferase
MTRVTIVGAGPGSADLITLRGARALAGARVVLHDALIDPALREMAPHAEWIDVGKRGFCDSTAQARINALLVQHAQSGGHVVRLKGGDPSVFGRLDEELEALAAAGIPCDVVPGVTAAIAAAADLRRPLTRRGTGRSVALSTAMTRAGQLVATRGADTEVFYMAGRQLAALSRRLLGAGWAPDTPVAVVSRAGWPDQHGSDHRVDTLPEAVVLHGGRPTVVIVGIGATALSPQNALLAQAAQGDASLPPGDGRAASPTPCEHNIALPPLPAGSKP